MIYNPKKVRFAFARKCVFGKGKVSCTKAFTINKDHSMLLAANQPKAVSLR